MNPGAGLLATVLACGPAASPASAEKAPQVEAGSQGGGKCDQVALRAAADAAAEMLTTWAPSGGELPDYRRAVRDLRAACPALPPGFHAFLEYGVHPVPDVSSQEMRLGPPLREDPAGRGPLLRQCPDYSRIMEDVAVRPGHERIPTIFAGCKFAELGVFTLAELATNYGDSGGLHGHALYLWLVDDGAPRDVARALVRPIVAGADYALEVGTRARLPTVAQAPAVGLPGPVLYASRGAVTFDARQLVLLAGGRVAAADQRDGLVGAVFDALAEETDKRNAIAERSGRKEVFELGIAGDPTLPWETMGKLVWTAGRAGAQELDVYVLVPEPMRPVATLPLLVAGPAPTIDLEIGANSIALRCGGKTGTHAVAALVGAVGGCGGGPLRLAAGNDTPWQRVVEVLGALAGQAAITEVVPP